MALFLVTGAACLLLPAAVALGEPEVFIDLPSPGTTIASDLVHVTGTARNATVVTVWLDNELWAPVADGVAMWRVDLSLRDLPSGNHTIRARAWNGSVESATAVRNFLLDFRVTVTILQPPAEVTLNVQGLVTVSGRVFLQGTSVPAANYPLTILVDDVWKANASTDSNGFFPAVIDLGGLASGDHTITVSPAPMQGEPASTTIRIPSSTHPDPTTLLWLVVLAVAVIAILACVGVYLVHRRPAEPR